MFLPRKTLDQMYKALVRSHLDYCDIIYHISSVQTQFGVTLTDLMENAERIQYQAALAITGAWQGSSRSKLYDELGWESLSERRWCKRILHIHKIVSNNTPSYLKDKLPRHRRPLYSQSNNKNNTFHGIKCRSSRYKNIRTNFTFCHNRNHIIFLVSICICEFCISFFILFYSLTFVFF